MDIRFNSDFIILFISKKKLTKKQFCEMCNISQGTLRRLLEQRSNISLGVALKISHAIGIEIKDLFVDDEY